MLGIAPPPQDRLSFDQLAWGDALQHTQDVEVREFFVVCAGCGGAVEDHANQAIMQRAFELRNQSFQFVRHYQSLLAPPPPDDPPPNPPNPPESPPPKPPPP